MKTDLTAKMSALALAQLQLTCLKELAEGTLYGERLLTLIEEYLVGKNDDVGVKNKTEVKASIAAVLNIIRDRADLYKDMLSSAEDTAVIKLLQDCSVEAYSGGAGCF
jgi:hypothetical protein